MDRSKQHGGGIPEQSQPLPPRPRMQSNSRSFDVRHRIYANMKTGNTPADAPSYPAPRLSHDDAKSLRFPAFNPDSMGRPWAVHRNDFAHASKAPPEQPVPMSLFPPREDKKSSVSRRLPCPPGSLPTPYPSHHVHVMTSRHQEPHLPMMPATPSEPYQPPPLLLYPSFPNLSWQQQPKLTTSALEKPKEPTMPAVPAIVIGATQPSAPTVSKQPPRKRYACDECGKKFSTRTLVRRHKMIHSDTRPHPCPLCPKRFRQREHLTKHIRIHTGERPFKCPHCSKTFVQKSTMTGHVRAMHAA
uniref:C2H2-type domain-containing protein n=1 Tax=Lotharella oceanica TaxID=641309 RepID=A0A7S2TT18_9EUKA|mmetsp:Transcript_28599/g.53609  ORF Transcript_28599/g.53609 Transcript_28599/m.53609 type:complete len:301 (+) Transcript_28599:133-1035(+)